MKKRRGLVRPAQGMSHQVQVGLGRDAKPVVRCKVAASACHPSDPPPIAFDMSNPSCRLCAMSLRHALLGLLADHPMTGYDLTRTFDRSLANVWPASHSQIYPELARLSGA